MKQKKQEKQAAKERKKRIGKILESIVPVEGEERAVCKCDICGHLFGCRYIPFSIGRGAIFNPCQCWATNNQHGKFTTIKTVSP